MGASNTQILRDISFMNFSHTGFQFQGLFSWLSAIHDVYGIDDPYDTVLSNKTKIVKL